MTLNEIKKHFEVHRLNNFYVLHDKEKAIYSDYDGCANYPFVGCIKKSGKNFAFIYEGMEQNNVVFDSVDRLKELVNEYVAACKSYGVTTDCCNAMYKDAYRCELAVIQFIRKNTDLKLVDNMIKAGSVSVQLRVKNNQLFVCLEYKENTWSEHSFVNPFAAIQYIKSILKVFLLMCLTEPVKNIRKIAATEGPVRYDTFNDDVLYKVDLPTLSIQHVGTLKEQLVNELEGILQQLKETR